MSPILVKAAKELAPLPPALDTGLPPQFPRPRFGHNGGGERGPAMSSARLGMLMFLGAETMFFSGLIGAFLVLRLGSLTWPPPFQPRLPVVVTGINTAILLFSGYTMRRALRALRNRHPQGAGSLFLMTALLGVIFLGVQGYEWVRLVHFGLTLSTGTYGATFYTLIGFHAVHVLGAVVWLLLIAARGRGLSAHSQVGAELCGMYWYFVVGLWPILYMLVYF